MDLSSSNYWELTKLVHLWRKGCFSIKALLLRFALPGIIIYFLTWRNGFVLLSKIFVVETVEITAEAKRIFGAQGWTLSTLRKLGSCFLIQFCEKCSIVIGGESIDYTLTNRLIVLTEIFLILIYFWNFATKNKTFLFFSMEIMKA